MCIAPVKSSPPTNQHPAFYRPDTDTVPVAQWTVSNYWRSQHRYISCQYSVMLHVNKLIIGHNLQLTCARCRRNRLLKTWLVRSCIFQPSYAVGRSRIRALTLSTACSLPVCSTMMSCTYHIHWNLSTLQHKAHTQWITLHYIKVI